MPLALFEKEEFRLRPYFPHHDRRLALRGGTADWSIDEANGRQRLDDGYAIKPCRPDSPECAEPADSV